MELGVVTAGRGTFTEPFGTPIAPRAAVQDSISRYAEEIAPAVRAAS